MLLLCEKDQAYNRVLGDIFKTKSQTYTETRYYNTLSGIFSGTISSNRLKIKF